MEQPEYFLTSERLGFRCWEPGDLCIATALWGDSAVTRLFSKEPFAPEQIKERLQQELATELDCGVQYWPMFELNSGEFVGCCGLRPYKREDKVYELGFHLRTEQWGKGYATEAARAVLKYGTEVLRLPAIFAGHHPDNSASRRVLLKLGFEEQDAEFYKPTGLYHPSYLFRAIP